MSRQAINGLPLVVHTSWAHKDHISWPSKQALHPVQLEAPTGDKVSSWDMRVIALVFSSGTTSSLFTVLCEVHSENACAPDLARL